MSYILDALRKSEQQRQAIQPDNVTDRILVNPAQPKQKPTKWIATLMIGNLLVIAYLFWFFTHKTPEEPQQKTKVADTPEQQLLPLTSEKRVLQPADIAEDRIQLTTDQPIAEPSKPTSTAPSIADIVETKKMAAIQRPSTKPIVEKKAIAPKKEAATRVDEPQPIRREAPKQVQEKPILPPQNKGTPDLNELSYEVRNTLPNLTINVFSYAQQPEERFVIIDMVKYKTGQLIKGSVTLKEIRPDSVVLQYGGDTFRVERP